MDWLVERLTPAKGKEARWKELAQVLQSLWQEFYDPEIDRVERLRSSYQADASDLALKIREMGDYFSYDEPNEVDRPISLAWRRLELEYKDMEGILRSAFRRHFGDFPVAWYPLFAPRNEPYGFEFLPADDTFKEESWQKNIAPEGYFLTSRGIIGIDRAGLFKKGFTKDTFRDIAFALVTRIKPLHIVFDGFLWYIRFPIDVPAFPLEAFWETENSSLLQFGPLGTRYDYIPADARYTDIEPILLRQETDWTASVNWGRLWGLDMFLQDGLALFGEYVLPLDLVLPGIEGEWINYALIAPQVTENRFVFDEHSGLYTLRNTTECELTVSVPVPVESDNSVILHSETELTHAPIDERNPDYWSLDKFYCDGFSDFSGDLPLLDCVIAGNESESFDYYLFSPRGREKTFPITMKAALHFEKNTAA